MIKTKKELLEYLEADKKALGKKYNKPKIIGDEIWRFQILLRKSEYYSNINKNPITMFLKYFYIYRFHKLRIKLGFSIPLNVFGSGLSIAHYGQITVNGNAKIGKNCRIHEGVTIGATNGNPNAPIIGDNVFIGSGAKIIGEIKIANNCAIGANSVVVKSFEEENSTLAGCPAKKISKKGSKELLII